MALRWGGRSQEYAQWGADGEAVPAGRASHLHRLVGRFLPTAAWQGSILSLPILACVTATWLVSIRGLDPHRMGNLGLVTILPPSFYVALAMLAISFAIVVHHRGTATPILFLHVVLLTLIIRATPIIIYGTVRYAWTYKHVAVIDYIQRHGSVDRSIDYLSIYHNWPGFFAVGALITQAAGLRSALTYANWAPVFFDLLDVPALLLIYRSFTRDRRLIWLGIWIYEIGNWVGQDYFSPQALGHTLFLYIVGICLQCFGTEARRSLASVSREDGSSRQTGIRHAALRPFWETDGRTDSGTPLQRRALLVVAALLGFILVSSHQLSPLVTVSALTLLVVFRQCRVWSLPLFVAALTVTWYLYPAQPYVHTHLKAILDSLGEVNSNLTAKSAAIHLPPDQQLIAHVAQGLTALVMFLALLGTIRRLRHGRWDVACVLLVLAPAPWLVVTHYGTEILFRIFLFALPFAAFLGGRAFFPSVTSPTAKRHAALTAVVSMLMLAALCISYYGQEKMDYVSPAELAAMQHFYETARPWSLLVQGSWDAPVPYQDYELYHYLSLQEMSDAVRRDMDRDPVGVLERQIHEVPQYSNAYLLVTRSQRAELRDIGLAPQRLMTRVRSAIARSPDFTLVFRSRDAALYLLVDHGLRRRATNQDHMRHASQRH